LVGDRLIYSPGAQLNIDINLSVTRAEGFSFFFSIILERQHMYRRVLVKLYSPVFSSLLSAAAVGSTVKVMLSTAVISSFPLSNSIFIMVTIFETNTHFYLYSNIKGIPTTSESGLAWIRERI
jgi:hypothetical protein